MRFLLEQARPDADIERAARAYVRGQMWRGELRWHPEMLTNRRIVGLEHLRAAQDLGRGVMLNFMHHGAYEGAFGSLGRRGVQLHMVVYPYMVRADAPRWLRQHMSVACTGGGQAVSAEIGTQGIIELLNQGKIVAVASDVPGRTPLRFVGRDVLGSFGAARIAADAGCAGRGADLRERRAKDRSCDCTSRCIPRTSTPEGAAPGDGHPSREGAPAMARADRPAAVALGNPGAAHD